MPPDLTPPPFDLGHLLNQSSYALTARMGQALSQLNLTVGQYCVLWKAAEVESTQVQIVQRAGLDKTTVFKALDDLERTGLATRVPHQDDRRAKVVRLTAQGLARLQAAHSAVAAVHANALSDLDGEEKRVLVEALEKVTSGVLATPSHVPALRRRRTPKVPPLTTRTSERP